MAVPLNKMIRAGVGLHSRPGKCGSTDGSDGATETGSSTGDLVARLQDLRAGLSRELGYVDAGAASGAEAGQARQGRHVVLRGV
jgi:hypothetical protein